MRGTWKPTRRNRNIGTPKSGYGQENRLVIPEKFFDYRAFWEKVIDYKIISRQVDGREIRFFVEPTKINYYYCCTIDDIVSLLQYVPKGDLDGINLFVFRQPKKKEEILSPVWGRLGYEVEIGGHKGPAIFIEAVNTSKSINWSKSLGPNELKRLEILRQDGHIIIENKREYKIGNSADSVRATQLYTTLFHEIGHWIQYKKEVLDPIRNGENVEDIENRYFSIPKSEREVFADRYAYELRKKLIESNIITFDRIYNQDEIDLNEMTNDFAK